MITQELLKEYLHYDPETGVFTWIKKNGKKIKPGQVAGKPYKSFNGKMYVRMGFLNKRYKVHRLAFLYMAGYIPNEVDHNDGNGLNNRWENLKDVTHKQNMRNRKLSSNNTSGYMGVSFNKDSKKWFAQVEIDGKNNYLGSFKDKEDAAKAAENFRMKMGFHKNHGKK